MLMKHTKYTSMFFCLYTFTQSQNVFCRVFQQPILKNYTILLRKKIEIIDYKLNSFSDLLK